MTVALFRLPSAIRRTPLKSFPFDMPSSITEESRWPSNLFFKSDSGSRLQPWSSIRSLISWICKSDWALSRRFAFAAISEARCSYRPSPLFQKLFPARRSRFRSNLFECSICSTSNFELLIIWTFFWACTLSNLWIESTSRFESGETDWSLSFSVMSRSGSLSLLIGHSWI